MALKEILDSQIFNDIPRPKKDGEQGDTYLLSHWCVGRPLLVVNGVQFQIGELFVTKDARLFTLRCVKIEQPHVLNQQHEVHSFAGSFTFAADAEPELVYTVRMNRITNERARQIEAEKERKRRVEEVIPEIPDDAPEKPAMELPQMGPYIDTCADSKSKGRPTLEPPVSGTFVATRVTGTGTGAASPHNDVRKGKFIASDTLPIEALGLEEAPKAPDVEEIRAGTVELHKDRGGGELHSA